MGPLTAFSFHPTGVRFETQEKEETVVLFLRQHMIVNAPWIILGLILMFSPTMLFPIILRVIKLPFSIPVRYIIVGTLFWYIASFGYLFGNFLHWFFNIYIITNKRIVDIDFVQLLYKKFSEANISKIQDLSYRTTGLLPTIFNYGDVYIQTAGELPNFDFEAVPHPEKIIQTISELSEKAKGNL